MDLDKIGFKVLPMLFEAGEAYVGEFRGWPAPRTPTCADLRLLWPRGGRRCESEPAVAA